MFYFPLTFLILLNKWGYKAGNILQKQQDVNTIKKLYDTKCLSKSRETILLTFYAQYLKSCVYKLVLVLIKTRSLSNPERVLLYLKSSVFQKVWF